MLVSLLLIPTANTYGQATDSGTASNALDAPLAGDPDECIDPLKAAHITATVISLLPIPGFSDGGDVAEYLANLALKLCEAVLDPSEDLVVSNPAEQSLIDNDPCTYYVRLPLTSDDMDLIVLDREMIQEIIAEISLDPTLRLSAAFLSYLEEYLASEFGRFESQKQGEYSDIYGIVFSSSSHGTDWGDLGSPDVYHYNSDIRVELFHPGERVDEDYIRFLPGDHALRWEGNTLISVIDFVPPIPGPFDNPVSEKVAKQTGEKSLREALRRAAREAIEQGSTEFAKKVAKETVKAFSEELAKNIAKKTLQTAVEETLESYFSLGKPHGVVQRDVQRVVILDGNAPVISGAQDITVEALEPGGASSGVHMAAEQAKLTVTDDCDPEPTLRYATPAFWPLNVDANGNPLPSSEIVWTAEDNGAATEDGGRNSSSAVSAVTVVDTKPPILVAPPPVVMEGTGAVDVPLGMAQVFDVADLRPTITNDAPAQFMPGVYRIQWQAIDASRNVSERTDDTEQIVNIKAPGTNVLPSAFDQTGANAVSAIADEPTRITVRGQDGNNPPDPLWFSIENQPENGFFIAPLYPYFIDDYRMAARYSPQIAAAEGEEFAWQVAQSPQAMRQYMIQLCEEDINRRDLPKDFVSDIQYLAVDDAGYTYIFDEAYRRCTPGGSTIAPTISPRISVWDQNGLYLGEQERQRENRPLRSIKFNVDRGTILTVRSDGSSTGNSTVDIAQIQPENVTEPVVSGQSYSLWNEINDVFVGDEQTARGPEFKNAGAAAFDNTNGVLYVIGDRNQNLKGMAALKPAPCNNSTGRGPEDCLDLLGVQVYSSPIDQTTKWSDYPGIGADAMRLRRIADIALDSQGAVHIIAEEDNTSQNGFHRIHKFAPATVSADGSVTPGEYIGWMGKCDSGPNCDYINQRSIGYRCTNETCFLDEGQTISGNRAGQFNNAQALAFDANDVLYVADTGNSPRAALQQRRTLRR